LWREVAKNVRVLVTADMLRLSGGLSGERVREWALLKKQMSNQTYKERKKDGQYHRHRRHHREIYTAWSVTCAWYSRLELGVYITVLSC
jgi:hypothetical protein